MSGRSCELSRANGATRLQYSAKCARAVAQPMATTLGVWNSGIVGKRLYIGSFSNSNSNSNSDTGFLCQIMGSRGW
eukprot:2360123-Pyramimonas_sp.AAC.2